MSPRAGSGFDYYYAENRHFKTRELVRDESHCYPSGWQARLGMTVNFTTGVPPSTRYLIRKKKKLWRMNFSNVVRGSFHACYLAIPLRRSGRGKGLMFEALTAAIRYMQRTRWLSTVSWRTICRTTNVAARCWRGWFEKEGCAKITC